MRTPKICSFNNIHCTLHILNFFFFILITGSLHILTIFIQFPFSPPTFGNHKSDLLFYESVYFWSINGL